jgi:hypothetical protein
MAESRHIEGLRAEEKYLRQRLELYRQKVYGPRPSNLARLRELEREHELAVSRLKRAESD